MNLAEAKISSYYNRNSFISDASIVILTHLSRYDALSEFVQLTA